MPTLGKPHRADHTRMVSHVMKTIEPHRRFSTIPRAIACGTSTRYSAPHRRGPDCGPTIPPPLYAKCSRNGR